MDLDGGEFQNIEELLGKCRKIKLTIYSEFYQKLQDKDKHWMRTFLYPPTLYSDRSTPTYYAYKTHIFYISRYNVESSYTMWAYLLQNSTKYHISITNKYIYDTCCFISTKYHFYHFIHFRLLECVVTIVYGWVLEMPCLWFKRLS